MKMLKQRKTALCVSLWLVFVLLFATLAGCTGKRKQPTSGTPPTTRTIVDMTGRKVTVPGQVKKVFSTSPVGTIMVYTLAPERLAGWNYVLSPVEKRFILPKYQQLPNLGGWYAKNTGNNEEILKVHPDVIISMGYTDPTAVSQADRIQQQLGIPVVMVEGELKQLDRAYEFLGDLLGVQSRARELAAYCRLTVGEVESKAKEIPAEKRVRVYYAEGPKVLQTEGKGSRHIEVLDLVGGLNAADIPGKGGTGMSEVSLEQVLAWNPEVILTWNDAQGGPYRIITTDPKWRGIRAVKDGRVYQVPHSPFNWFDRPPSVNRLIGVKWLANLLYPDVFKYDIVKEAKEFYAKFYHYNLTDQEARDLLAHSRSK